MKQSVIPQALHKPLQILWFDLDEVRILAGLYLPAMMFGGVMWIFLVVAPFIIIPEKRKAPRGALVHLLYRMGLYGFGLQGYPPASAYVFNH